jgi:hypothetical protein
MRKNLPLISLLWFLAQGVFAQEFVYNVTCGGDAFQERFVLDRTGGLITVTCYGKNEFRQSTNTSDLETRRFVLRKKNQPEWVITLADNTLEISGGPGRRASYPLEKEVWIQDTVSLLPIIQSGKKETPFVSIALKLDKNGLTIPGEIEKLGLKWVRQNRENLTAAGQELPAIKYHLTVNDWRSVFWKAEYWFRESDGLLLKSIIPQGPGKPDKISVIALQPEDR